MKKVFHFFFAISLLTNGIFLWAEYVGHPLRAPAAPVFPKFEPSRETAPVVPLPVEVWKQIQEGDPRAFALLRSAGFSEILARAIVSAKLETDYRPREKALYADPQTLKYWRKAGFNLGPRSQVALLDLRREKKSLTERVTGVVETDLSASANPRLAFLPEEKARRVQEIVDEYAAIADDLRGSGIDQTPTLPAEREKLAYLEKEKRVDLEQVLTPEELVDYDLRNSPTASMLRTRLAAFRPTEEEFREIFDAFQKNVPENYLRNDLTGPVSREQAEITRQSWTTTEAEIKVLLGDERFAEYTRSRNDAFQTLSEIGTRLALPPERAVEAFQFETSVEKRLAESKYPPETYNKFVAMLSADTAKELTRILGPVGYEAFRERSPFLKTLVPTKTLPPPVGEKKS